MSKQLFSLPPTVKSEGLVGQGKDLFRPGKHVRGFPMTPARRRRTPFKEVSFTRDGQVVNL